MYTEVTEYSPLGMCDSSPFNSLPPPLKLLFQMSAKLVSNPWIFVQMSFNDTQFDHPIGNNTYSQAQFPVYFLPSHIATLCIIHFSFPPCVCVYVCMYVGEVKSEIKRWREEG